MFSGFFVVLKAAPSYPIPMESSKPAYASRPTEGKMLFWLEWENRAFGVLIAADVLTLPSK